MTNETIESIAAGLSALLAGATAISALAWLFI